MVEVFSLAVLSVTGFDGYIQYGQTNNSQSHDTTNGQAGGGGGISGSGSIWSGSSQVIWVSAGGVKYPIYLEPGWNDVEFWIPTIYPQDDWVECPIIIEAPGYILIPGGFEWAVITGIGAPPGPARLIIGDTVIPMDNVILTFEGSPSGQISHIEIGDTVYPEDNVFISKTVITTKTILIGDTVTPKDNTILATQIITSKGIQIGDTVTPKDNTILGEE